jgi:hypothetical protein
VHRPQIKKDLVTEAEVRFVGGGNPYPFKERYNEKAHKDKGWTADEINNGKAYPDNELDPMTFLNNNVMAPEYLETKKYEKAEEAVYKNEAGTWTVSKPSRETGVTW